MLGTILFRVDASNLIGSGHLMRCLTLANEARLRGWRSIFAMRDPSRAIIDKVKVSGHELCILVEADKKKTFGINELAHSDWLAVSQETDALETSNLVKNIIPDWVVVDHYAIDAVWHKTIRKTGAKLLVIDDLADRVLDCDILVNQNLGFLIEDYDGKIKTDTKIFLGPKYAILRPEFREWREFSLNRRKAPILNKVLISMGGVDAQNKTLKVLQSLEKSINAVECEFLVVLGALYPFLDEIDKYMATSVNKITKLTNIVNIGEIMANSDVCIGAAGTSAWERCCLGLPAMTLILADNQTRTACSLNERHATVMTDIKNLKIEFEMLFQTSGLNKLKYLTKKSSELCDGFGALRILKSLE